MLNSNNQGIPPFSLGPNERLVVDERSTWFGKRTTYKVVQSNDGSAICAIILILGILATGLYFFG